MVKVMTDEMVTVLVAGTGVRSAAVSDGVEIIGHADTGNAALERVVAELPDVLLLDAAIDGVDVTTLCRQIREWAPATRILVMTGADDDAAYTTVVSGAAGIVESVTTSETTGHAVRAVARGESLLLPHAARRLMHDIDAWAEQSADPIHPPPTLTATEREVLTRLAEGLVPIQIAEVHAVTARLVNVHAGYAVAKLQRYVLGEERIAAES